MLKTTEQLGEVKLAGVKIRTIATEGALPLSDANSGEAMQRWFTSIQPNLPNRTRPNVLFTLRLNHDNTTGECDYFFGEEVSSFEGIGSEVDTMTMPAQTYAKYDGQPNSPVHVSYENLA